MARAEEGVNRMAAGVGLHLALHERLINSRPALQAAEFAREQGRFDAMHHELLKAYWDEVRTYRTSLSSARSPRRPTWTWRGWKPPSRMIDSAITSMPGARR